MPNYTFPWTRKWVPEKQSAPVDPEGFLLPTAEAASRYGTTAVELTALESVRCLVLLGEPGMGKSTALRDQAERDRAAGKRVAAIDLKTIENGEALTEELKDALSTGADILAIDSLDEGLLRVDTIFSTLLRRLKSHAKSVDQGHMQVRIACRAAEWPDGGAGRLAEIFGPDSVMVHELAPLTRADVALAASHVGLDELEFIAQVVAREAVPFATRPVTLLMLLDMRRRGEALPNRQVELYERGCLRLCEEIDEKRRKTASDARQRLAVARRVAALLVYTRHSTIDTRPAHEAEHDALHIADIAGSVEVLDGREFPVNEPDVRDALETALFRSAGEGRYTFVHQTYAEFLAASYLVIRGLSEERILGIIRHPGSPGCVVPPQLAETAGWLASQDPTLFRRLVRDNPDTMLRSDVAAADPADRAALVDAYLMACADEKVHDWDQGRFRLYQRLAHPGLADQLRPWIRDRTRTGRVRSVALDIAEACATSALEGDLLAMVLDETEPPKVRSDALSALIPVLREENRQALVPIAIGVAGNDPSDELRGKALPLVWPGILDTPRMMESLIYPQRENLIGFYHAFLQNGLLDRLPDGDVRKALDGMARWIADNPKPPERGHRDFPRLAAHLSARGLEQLNDADVRDAVARLLINLNRNHEWYEWDRELQRLSPPALADRNQRRSLAQAMASMLVEEHAAHHLFYHPPLLDTEDVEWSLVQLRQADSEAQKRLWSYVIWMLWRQDIETFALIAQTAEVEPELHRRFILWLDGIPLDSEAARSSRQVWEHDREHQEYMRRHGEREPFTCEVVRKLAADRLDFLEQGNPAGWWDLVRILYEQPEDGEGAVHVMASVDAMAGFSCLDEPLRRRIVPAARWYVENGDPAVNAEEDGEDLWWNTANRHDWRAEAGVLALGHLHRHEPTFVTALSAEIWAKWAPAITAFTWSDDDGSVADALFPLCLASARDATLAALRQRIATQVKGGDTDAFRLLHGCWDADLADIVVSIMSASGLNNQLLRNGLKLLLSHNHQLSQQLFQQASNLVPDADEGSVDNAATILATVFLHDAAAHWAVINEIMGRNLPLARAFFLAIARQSGGSPSAGTLSQLPGSAWVTIYMFLAQHFPPGRDLEGGWVSPLDEAREFREGIIRYLAETGTPEAIGALESLRQQLPDQAPWLGWHLITARQRMVQKTWTPPTPAALLELVSRPLARLVRSGEELLELILDSLSGLQVVLQGETPLARSLWNEAVDEDGEAAWSNKDENFLSDLVKKHLQEDIGRQGAVANREVEIRASKSADKGQRTDITVNAVMRQAGMADPLTIATVIIEVKGCWHAEVMTAMETQLRDRYMVDTNCSFGLYLVGWFVCDRWANPRVGARKPAADLTIDLLRQQLNDQATSLSEKGRTISAFVLDAAIH
ncbi:NACHT domain-containing protein [Azospirillum argentinense]